MGHRPRPHLPPAWDGTFYPEYDNRASQAFRACSVAATVLIASSPTMPLESEKASVGEVVGFQPWISDSKIHMLSHRGSVPCSSAHTRS